MRLAATRSRSLSAEPGLHTPERRSVVHDPLIDESEKEAAKHAGAGDESPWPPMDTANRQRERKERLCAVADPICRPSSIGPPGQANIVCRHMRYRMRHRAAYRQPFWQITMGVTAGRPLHGEQDPWRAATYVANWRCGCSRRSSCLIGCPPCRATRPAQVLTPACSCPAANQALDMRPVEAPSPIASWRLGQGNWPSGSRQDPAPAGPLRGLCSAARSSKA